MPRERVRRDTVYQYDELSDNAKRRALEWWAEACAGDNSFSESIIDDFCTIAHLMGWEVSTRQPYRPPGVPSGAKLHAPPSVYFSGFCSQGDGACFEGTWRASDVNLRGLKKYAPRDKELHRIARALRDVAKREPNASGTSTHTGRGYHEHSVTLALESYRERERDDLAETVEAWEEATRDLMRWLYRTLEKEYEYQTWGEGAVESILANEYEFTEEGRRA